MRSDQEEEDRATAAVALGGAKLEHLTGLPKTKWSRIFGGFLWPLEKTLIKLAKELDCDPDYLAIALRRERIRRKRLKLQKVDSKKTP
jgi:hypothetical protein